jgi:hypothetical protein
MFGKTVRGVRHVLNAVHPFSSQPVAPQFSADTDGTAM